MTSVRPAEPEEPRAELPWRAFCTEGLVVIMPVGSGCDSDVQALSSFPFIRFKRYAWAGRLIHDELRRRGIEVNETMEVDTLEGIVSLVASGLGVSVVPHRHLRRPFPVDVEHLPFGHPQVSLVSWQCTLLGLALVDGRLLHTRYNGWYTLFVNAVTTGLLWWAGFWNLSCS